MTEADWGRLRQSLTGPEQKLLLERDRDGWRGLLLTPVSTWLPDLSEALADERWCADQDDPPIQEAKPPPVFGT